MVVLQYQCATPFASDELFNRNMACQVHFIFTSLSYVIRSDSVRDFVSTIGISAGVEWSTSILARLEVSKVVVYIISLSVRGRSHY